MRELEPVYLCYDELEAVRLCDVEKLTQQQAGDRMGVSRGTVQRLVDSGRKKMTEAIVMGCALVIEAMNTDDSR